MINTGQQKIHHFEDGLEEVLLVGDHLVPSRLLDSMDLRIYFHSSLEEDLVGVRVGVMEEIHLQVKDLEGAFRVVDQAELGMTNTKLLNQRLHLLSMLSKW